MKKTALNEMMEKTSFRFDLSPEDREFVNQTWWDAHIAPVTYIKGEEMTLGEYSVLMNFFIEKYTTLLKMGI